MSCAWHARVQQVSMHGLPQRQKPPFPSSFPSTVFQHRRRYLRRYLHLLTCGPVLLRLQVVRHVVAPRNCDLPSINPAMAGRPHTHAYLSASIVETPDAFTPNQVCVLALRLGSFQVASAPELLDDWPTCQRPRVLANPSGLNPVHACVFVLMRYSMTRLVPVLGEPRCASGHAGAESECAWSHTALPLPTGHLEADHAS